MAKNDASSLSPVWFQILLALADAPRHGYAIMQEVEARTGGSYRLWPATLYTTMKRMLAEGVVEEADPPDGAVADDTRRRYYRLTVTGRDLLEREAARLEALLQVARAKNVLV